MEWCRDCLGHFPLAQAEARYVGVMRLVACADFRARAARELRTKFTLSLTSAMEQYEERKHLVLEQRPRPRTPAATADTTVDTTTTATTTTAVVVATTAGAATAAATATSTAAVVSVTAQSTIDLVGACRPPTLQLAQRADLGVK